MFKYLVPTLKSIHKTMYLSFKTQERLLPNRPILNPPSSCPQRLYLPTTKTTSTYLEIPVMEN